MCHALLTMKNKVPSAKSSESPSLSHHHLRYRILLGVVLLFAGAAAFYYRYIPAGSNRGQTALSSLPVTEQRPDDPAVDAVQRAIAVDRLFHQVYTPTWQGANGAIGDSYVFAATGDRELLSLYTDVSRLVDMNGEGWVDNRAWVCLAEMHWWDVSGRKNAQWVADAARRYANARTEGRLAHPDGFWSWYNYPPSNGTNGGVFTNTNMNQMAAVACRLYDATHEQQYFRDALLVWNGDGKIPGVEKKFYRGNGRWEGGEGRAAFGKQFPWEGAGMCSIAAEIYRMTGERKYRDAALHCADALAHNVRSGNERQSPWPFRVDAR